MPVQFLAKKNINGWLFTLYPFRGSFFVSLHATNGKPYYQKFATEAKAKEYFTFMCSKFTAFHSKATKSKEPTFFQ